MTTLTVGALPVRRGPPPATSHPAIPHQQFDQFADDASLRATLAATVFGLGEVEERPTRISVPGARALWLTGEAAGDPEAFLAGREFAHIHPDGSLHVTLPTEEAAEAVARGWAEWHPWVDDGRLPATVVLVFAPRSAAEVEVVTALVARSLQFATAPPTI
jgi:hypothetical protein